MEQPAPSLRNSQQEARISAVLYPCTFAVATRTFKSKYKNLTALGYQM